jgi:DNA helicase II / ATP-dependent DNA helicase PcrA
MAGQVEQQIFECIENHESFILDAGAGSGKTWTLVQTLNYLIETNSTKLKNNNQKIVCITYTNVAKDEIIERTEHNEIIHVSTIHDFLWDCIKPYQKELKITLINVIEEKLSKEQEKLNVLVRKTSKARDKSEERVSKLQEAIENLNAQKSKISYENYPKYIDGKFSHDDLIIIAEKIFSSYPKIIKIISDANPIIFVDEYQDTQKETVQILDYLLGSENFIVGFFGDKVQQIYDSGVGEISSKSNLKLIQKTENYRSSKEVIELLNKLRSDIEQYQPEQNKRNGSITFYKIQNTEDFNVKSFFYSDIKDVWNVESVDAVKILYLTHRYIAKENHYEELLQHYIKTNKRDCLIDNESNRTFCPFADFLYDLEDIIALFADNKIQQFLKKISFKIDSFKDKKTLFEVMQNLSTFRKKERVLDVIEFATSKKILPKSERMNNYDFEDEEKKEFYETLMQIEYSQFSRLYEVQQENTPFSTKHNTKGDEFNNVIVIIDDNSWKQSYNFNDFFSDNKENENRYKRTNNLFYVVCSRAMYNLAVVCTSELSEVAKSKLKEWFGKENFFEIN